MFFDKYKDRLINFIRKRAFIITLSAVSLIVYIVLGLVTEHIKSTLVDQNLAERWSEDMRMAQVSIFATEDQMIREDDIKKFSYLLEKKLAEAGVSAGDEDEEGDVKTPEIIDTIDIEDMNKKSEEEELLVPQKTPLQELYSVAYCAQGKATLGFENRISENTTAIGVGGDFFLFHPMTFVTGSYFSGDDLMKDKIVIDEEMAWQLVGSTDIIGQSVTIGGIPHYVSGVVKRNGGMIRKGDAVEVLPPLPDRPYTAAIITLSDKGSKGEREDKSGPVIEEMLLASGIDFEITEKVQDNYQQHDETQTETEHSFLITFLSFIGRVLRTIGNLLRLPGLQEAADRLMNR